METSTRKLVMSNPAEFRKRLRVEARGTFLPLAEIADPWQERDFLALDDGWKRVVGVENNPAVCNRGYLERGRGHSKTSDLATMAAWALFASRKKIIGTGVASDREQGRLLREAIQTLVLANPWLAEYLSPERDRVKNKITESELTILSSDAGSSYGTRPDFVIVDELTHWGAGGQESWNAAFSAAAKKDHCMLVIISNAGTGMGKSWQWDVRERARNSDAWYFSRLDGPVASWISERRLAEQRNMLPPSAYSRLWLNQWVTSAGDALDPDDIAACLTLTGPQLPEEEMVYVGGLDLGIKHDHAGFVICGTVPGSGRVKVCQVLSWPPIGGRVDLAAVERGVRECHEKYNLYWVGFDPFQAQYMAQRLEADGIPVCEVAFTGDTLTKMAVELLGAFRGRKIDLFPDFLLTEDLGKLSIVERGFNFKLTAVSDKHGHADRATALAIALPAAMEIANAIEGFYAEDEEDDDRIDWRVVLD